MCSVIICGSDEKTGKKFFYQNNWKCHKQLSKKQHPLRNFSELEEVETPVDTATDTALAMQQ